MVYRAVLAVVMFCAASTCALAAQTQHIPLHPMPGSKEAGMATLTRHGSDLLVTIAVTGMPAGSPPEFAHIHSGTCQKLGKPTAYDLEPVRHGYSTTTLKNVDRAMFSRGAYSIAIHQTLAHISRHIVCGGPVAPF